MPERSGYTAPMRDTVRSVLDGVRRPALEIVTAVRLPRIGERTGRGAFDATGDVTVECDATDEHGKRCGWRAAGPRSDVKLAQEQHRRMFHSQATSPIVTLLNQPRL